MPGMFNAPFDNVDEFLRGAGPSSRPAGFQQDWHNEFEAFQESAHGREAGRAWDREPEPLSGQFHVRTLILRNFFWRDRDKVSCWQGLCQLG